MFLEGGGELVHGPKVHRARSPAVAPRPRHARKFGVGPGTVFARRDPRRVLAQRDESELSRLLRVSLLWELLVALASVVVIALLTWLITRVLARWLSGKTRFGLRGLHRLVAPMTALVSVLVVLLIVRGTPREPAVIGELLELVAAFVGFWLAARVLDVIWATAGASARLRTGPRMRPRFGTLLLVSRHLGKLVLALAALGVLAVQLGASDQLYVILAAAAAGLAFAARDPIRNAVAFIAMTIDPPFHVGDRVRVSDYRSGQSSVGTVTDISLTAVTLHTRADTNIVIANVMLGQLQIENLSAADRRRLELEIPVTGLSTESLRDACAAIDDDLREHPGVSPDHTPRVWLAGASGGLHLKVSLWLRHAADRREVQREVLLKIHDRLAARRSRSPEPLPEPEPQPEPQPQSSDRPRPTISTLNAVPETK